MKNILWTQNETPTKPNTFVIDGAVSQYCGRPDQDEAMRSLTMGPQSKQCENLEYSNARQQLGLSSNFMINVPFVNGIFIQGLYKERDESGRQMPYMFLTTETNDLASTIIKLREYSALVGKTLVETDLEQIPYLIEILSNQKKKGSSGIVDFYLRNKVVINSLVAIVLLTIIIYIVWNL